MKYTAIFLIALVALTMATKSPASQVLDKVDDLVEASRDE